MPIPALLSPPRPRLHDPAGQFAFREIQPLLATHSLDIVEHYADRAAVLIDGRLKKEWQQDEIRQLRASHGDFEAALAQSIQ